jgi:hypothetical protein
MSPGTRPYFIVKFAFCEFDFKNNERLLAVLPQILLIRCTQVFAAKDPHGEIRIGVIQYT